MTFLVKRFFAKGFGFIFTLLLLLASSQPSRAIIDSTLQMQLGNPSGATNDPTNHSHYLILRSVEAIDYDDNLAEPNWASWDLTASDVGSTGRSDAWAADTSLPSGFFEVGPNDYSGSGYDRGHMCPSGDRTDTVPDNEMVFLMSNIIPQAPDNNEGVWANFETYCRTLAQSGNELLIICGPGHFSGAHIDNGHVAVPDFTWKVAAVVPAGSGTALSRVTSSTRIIAIEVPNTNGVSSVWQNFVLSAGQVQHDTGFTFFTAVPETVGSALRAKVDGVSYPAPTISSFTPGIGAANTNVVITGNNFYNATTVSFNGLDAVFSVDSNTQITAIVPTNATSGHIALTTASGTVTSTGTFAITADTTAPDLTITTSHSGNFTQGDAADTYTISVTNVGAPTTGVITVSNFLPAGLTATALSGIGWTADLVTLTCTRSDTFGNNVGLPPITLTVSVLTNAPSSPTNFTFVSTIGDTNLQNNTAADVTAIIPASAPTVTTGAANNISSATATLNGTVNPNNQPATVRFEYGVTTNYTATSSVPSNLTGNTAQSVSVSVSDLAASTTYHFRTVAANIIGSVFGADHIFTTAAVVGVSNVTLVGWDVSGLTNFGASSLPATTNAVNLTISGLRRGSGVTTNGSAALRAWGGNGFASATAASAITANEFATFSIAATPGYKVYCSAISKFDYRRSNAGPTNGVLQYQLNSAPFVDIVSLSYPSNNSGGASVGPIDLSAVTALQGVGAGTNITFRIVNYSATASGGNWYVFDVSNSPALDFALQGTVSPILTPIESWRLQYFGTTANSGPAADTAIATGDGMPNLLKYALGLDPLVPTNNPVVGDISTGFLRLTLPKNPNATDISYYVEIAPSVTGQWTTTGTIVDQNTAALLQVHATHAIVSVPSQFIRLEVTRP